MGSFRFERHSPGGESLILRIAEDTLTIDATNPEYPAGGHTHLVGRRQLEFLRNALTEALEVHR